MKPQKAQHKYLADALKNPKWVGREYMMMPKLDGWYGYMDLGSGVGISSNAQRVIPSCSERSRELAVRAVQEDLPQGRLIFEITVDSEPQFELMNGILNRKAVCPDARLNVHDFISKEQPNLYVLNRHTQAVAIVDVLNLNWIEPVYSLGVTSNSTVWNNRAEQLIDGGGEGLILKATDCPYKPGVRCADLMKIKEESEFDLVVTGMQKGNPGTKYGFTLGALIVMDAKHNKFTVSGMTDVQRDAWWQDPALIVGKVVKVKCKNVMKDGSMREPRFNAIRWDKTADDINEVK